MPSYVITGTGSYVPPRILTNDDLATMVDTTADWIMTRTGMKERRISDPQVSSSDLMVPAAQAALKMAGKRIDEVDLIYVSYSFPDQQVPSTSDILAEKLGAPRDLLAIDVTAQCSGFCWALGQAYDRMRLYPEFRTVLVVSGDATSKFVDYEDRETCVLFGDGAGAVVIERIVSEDFGILGYYEACDRLFLDCLSVQAGGTAKPASHDTVANREHFMHFGPNGGGPMLKAIVKAIPDLRSRVYARASIDPDLIRLIIPHQLNQRIVDASKRRSSTPVYDDNIPRFGNCSGSSVAMALDTAYREGRIAYRDFIQLESYGAGLKYGAVVIRWWLPRFRD